jgi:lysozyme
MTMTDLIKRYEGFRSSPYKCSANKWTIGYGSTFYEDGRRVRKTDPAISKERATQLLEHYLDTQIRPCINKYVKPVSELTYMPMPLTDNERMALESIIYNIGCTNFIRSTLLKKINAGRMKEAGNQFLAWKYITKKGKKVVSHGLLKRRRLERELFLTAPYEKPKPRKIKPRPQEPTKKENWWNQFLNLFK